MKSFLIITLLFLNLFAYAEDKPEARIKMQQFYMLTNKMQNYILNKDEFVDKKNEKTIASDLKIFREETEKLKKEKFSKSDDMKFLAKQLAEDLSEAEVSFRNGFKDYSYWVLKSSFNSCFNCHTQKNLSNTEFKLTATSHNNDNGYATADFLFIIRNYPDALKIFEKIITDYPKNKATTEQIDNSLKKVLFYSIRVSKNEQETINLFNTFLKNKSLPDRIKEDITAWKNYLNIKKYRLIEPPSILNQKALEKFIEDRKSISDSYAFPSQRYIVDLETNHYLFTLLEKNKDKDLKPWILYYSADVEKDHRSSMFDMTVDRYLKECIERYSQSPAAKKCFSLYKELQTAGFTGSRGTDIPEDIQKQLKKYEVLINKK